MRNLRIRYQSWVSIHNAIPDIQKTKNKAIKLAVDFTLNDAYVLSFTEEGSSVVNYVPLPNLSSQINNNNNNNNNKGNAGFRTTVSDNLFEMALGEESSQTLSVVAAEFAPEKETISVALSDGTLIQIDPESMEMEAVGKISEDEKESSSESHPSSFDKPVLYAMKWSPEGELIVLVSSQKMYLMTKDYDPIAETVLNISHGEENREDPIPKVSISWRSDGQFFVVNVAGQLIGVYNRDGSKHADVDINACYDTIEGLKTNEKQQHEDTTTKKIHALPALTGYASWQPRVGGVISVLGPGHSMVSFFERNGLHHRRNDFPIHAHSLSMTFTGILWNSDSSLLAISFAEPHGLNHLHIYYRGNYHWYLKQDLQFKCGIADFCWHDEAPLELFVLTTDGDLIAYEFSWVVTISLQADSSCLVIDGSTLKVTPFVKAIVPPPMSLYTKQMKLPIRDICVTMHSDENENNDLNGFALLSDQSLQSLRDPDLLLIPENIEDIEDMAFPVLRSTIILTDSMVAFLKSGKTNDAIVVYKQENGKLDCIFEQSLGTFAIFMSSFHGEYLWICMANNQVLKMEYDSVQNKLIRVQTFQWSSCIEIVSCQYFQDKRYEFLVGITKQGRLDVFDLLSSHSVNISKDCTSFELTNEFLLWTSMDHNIRMLHVLESTLAADFDQSMGLEHSLLQRLDVNFDSITPKYPHSCRPIDRGSLIVSALRDDSRIILQAPRGNLEVITPRPLVLLEVFKLLEKNQFADAFRLCRKQRINVNVMISEKYFRPLKENISDFILGINDANLLNVFLTSITAGKEMIAKFNSLCQLMVSEIDKLAPVLKNKLVTTTISGLLLQIPPDHKTALLRVRDLDSSHQEKAIDYMLVLNKDNEYLFQEALGTYDLRLAALISVQAQLDPKETSILLKNFNQHPEDRRKYEIDVYLGRFSRALGNLYACGPEYYSEALDFAEKHNLFEEGLSLFKQQEKAVARLRKSYADHLVGQMQYEKAGWLYSTSGHYGEAALAFQNSGNWRLAISCGESILSWSKNEFESFLEKLASTLVVKGQVIDGANVYGNWLRNYNEAIETCMTAEYWVHALEYHKKSKRFNGKEVMSEASFKERAIDAAEQRLEFLKETESKLRERGKRLEAVRKAKALLRETIGKDSRQQWDEADSDTFSQTDASSVASSQRSDFTFISKSSASLTSLYSSSTAPTDQLSERAIKKRERAHQRREAKKNKKKIREGHPMEEEYLVEYLSKLIPQNTYLEKIGYLIQALLQMNEIVQAGDLQCCTKLVLDQAEKLPADIYTEEIKTRLLACSWSVDVLEVL